MVYRTRRLTRKINDIPPSKWGGGEGLKQKAAQIFTGSWHEAGSRKTTADLETIRTNEHRTEGLRWQVSRKKYMNDYLICLTIWKVGVIVKDS